MRSGSLKGASHLAKSRIELPESPGAPVKSLQKALDARRQRIVISQTNVSRVRWFGLLVTGLCVLIGIAFAHLDNRRNCRIALVLFATGMSASILIIACHSRPFNSTVGPELLHEIKAQYSID